MQREEFSLVKSFIGKTFKKVIVPLPTLALYFFTEGLYVRISVRASGDPFSGLWFCFLYLFKDGNVVLST